MEVTAERKREVVALVDLLVAKGFDVPKIKIFTSKGNSKRFNCPLSEILSEDLMRTKSGLQVPRVFYDLLRYLEHNGGMQTPGIFRLNGSSRKITMAKETLNEGKQLPTDTPVTVLSGLMKGYLRDQPEGILAPIRELMLQAHELGKLEPIVLVSIVKLLPPHNHDLFLYLIHMLSKIDAKATKMDTTNLSLVFAINLFHHDPKTAAKKKLKTALDAKEEEGKLSQVVATLINNINLFKRFKSELKAHGITSDDSDEKIAKRYNRFAHNRRRRSSLNMVKENLWNTLLPKARLPTRKSQTYIHLNQAKDPSTASSSSSDKDKSKKKRSFKTEKDYGQPLESVGKRRRSDVMTAPGTPKQPISTYGGMDSSKRVPYPRTPTMPSKAASRVHTPNNNNFMSSRRGKSRSGYGMSPFKPRPEPLIQKNKEEDLDVSMWSNIRMSKDGDNIYNMLKKERLRDEHQHQQQNYHFKREYGEQCGGESNVDDEDCHMVDKNGNVFLNLPV